MAHPNEDLMLDGFEAFATGDMETLMALWTDDVVWHSPGRSPLAGDYSGAQELMGLFAQVFERSGGTYRNELLGISADDSIGFALATGKAERDGKSLDSPAVWVFRFQGQKVAEIWFHPYDLYASDEFWND